MGVAGVEKDEGLRERRRTKCAETACLRMGKPSYLKEPKHFEVPAATHHHLSKCLETVSTYLSYT